MDTRRDFIFIDDVVDVVDKAVEGMGNRGYYHISTGLDFSTKELYLEAIEALGMPERSNVEVRPMAADDVRTILIDPSETERTFGWKAKTPLKEGVRRTIEYYKKFGLNRTFTHLRMEK
jgi:UDP-glucose 4-epimerase